MEDNMENVQIEYSLSEDHDGIGEGKSDIPIGYKTYLGVTVLWMFYYTYMYTPLFSGWTQTAGLN